MNIHELGGQQPIKKDKVYGIERAPMFKRISAALFDAIIIVIITLLFAWLVSVICDYNGQLQIIEDKYAYYYEQEYKAEDGNTYKLSDFEIELEEIPLADNEDGKYQQLSDTGKEVYRIYIETMQKDEELMKAALLINNFMVLIPTLALLFTFLIYEFIIPIILKNGQTVGKKMFGTYVVKNNCVRVSHVQMFIRAILGKFTIEFMIPFYILLMILSQSIGLLGTILIAIILLVELVVIIATKNHTAIHDMMAGTVVVDKASQMVFESEQALVDFQKERGKTIAEDRKY